MLMTCDLVSPV